MLSTRPTGGDIMDKLVVVIAEVDDFTYGYGWMPSKMKCLQAEQYSIIQKDYI